MDNEFKKYYKYLLPENMLAILETLDCKWVNVGLEIIKDATYDENGNELTPAILGTKYMVDVIWESDEHPDFVGIQKQKPNRIRHWFGGGEAMELYYVSNGLEVPERVRQQKEVEKFDNKKRKDGR